MYLNQFSPSAEPIDMTAGEEFANLLTSARDLGIEARRPVRYVSRNIVVNGLRIHLLEWGDEAAPPIVLVHGGGQSAHSWDLVSLVLAQRFRVVAFDQRGHGDSEWPRDGDMASTSMAEDLVAVIATLGLARPIIAGHSLGGIATMFALVKDPQLAERVVFVDISAEQPAAGGNRRDADQHFEFDSLEDFIAEVQRRETGRTDEHIRRTARYNLMQRADGKWVPKRAPRGGGMPARPGLEAMRAIECPALLIHGAVSTSLSDDAAERFAKALPQGRLVTVPGVGHNVHSQDTPGFLAELLPFVGFEAAVSGR